MTTPDDDEVFVNSYEDAAKIVYDSIKHEMLVTDDKTLWQLRDHVWKPIGHIHKKDVDNALVYAIGWMAPDIFLMGGKTSISRNMRGCRKIMKILRGILAVERREELEGGVFN